MVGNWKSNPKTITQAQKLYSEIYKESKKYKSVQTVICPTFVHISIISKVSKNEQCVVGAQDGYWEDTSNQTGKVSFAQLEDLNVRYCIVGHSSQRESGETDESISQKIQTLLKKGMIPILCVGESVRDEQGAYLAFIEDQIKSSLAGLPQSKVSKVVIAYEPLWAIGKDSKRPATSKEVEEIFILIKRTISDLYNLKSIPTNRLLYGGSVSSKKDIQEFVGIAGADGCLVGRASLQAKTWNSLVQAASEFTEK